MQNKNEIQEVLVSLEEAKKAAGLRDAIQRLFENADYKLVIEEGYFREEAARMVMLLGDPRIPASGKEAMAADMTGPGALNRYFNAVLASGYQADNAIQELDDALEELRAGTAV